MGGEGKSDRKYKRMSGIKLQNALAYLEHHRSAGEKPLCPRHLWRKSDLVEITIEFPVQVGR